MASSIRFVIIGGGLAGAKAVEALRDSGFDGQIILFAEEQHLPYERPPLSKEYLAGKKSLTDFTVQNSDWYHDHECRPETRCRGCRPWTAPNIPSDSPTAPQCGTRSCCWRQDRLRVARRYPGPTPTQSTICAPTTMLWPLNSVLTEGSSLAVVGAGWIGLEVAAAARQRGVDVTVVETAKQPLVAALGETVGEVFANLHRDHGVDLRLEAQVEEITTTGRPSHRTENARRVDGRR